MRVGCINYATEQGLGILARSFYRAGVVTDFMIVQHSRPTHPEWYPEGTPVVDVRRDQGRMRDFCRGLDALLILETPFDWGLVEYCRHIGVRTVLMPMYECMPRRLPARPDEIVNPSLLDQRYYPDGVFLPVPVDSDLVPYRRRERAEVFVHNAGHGGLKGRNGTAEVLEAVQHLKSMARILIRTQDPLGGVQTGRIEVRSGTIPYDLLWTEGDVFLFPEKFNGLSLPLQEARASGMLVMCGDRFPMNTWLPRGPLIPLKGYRSESVSPRCNLFEEAIIEPRAIAARIDEWYGRDISAYSESAVEWRNEMSWERLRPRYMEVIEG